MGANGLLRGHLSFACILERVWLPQQTTRVLINARSPSPPYSIQLQTPSSYRGKNEGGVAMDVACHSAATCSSSPCLCHDSDSPAFSEATNSQLFTMSHKGQTGVSDWGGPGQTSAPPSPRPHPMMRGQIHNRLCL